MAMTKAATRLKSRATRLKALFNITPAEYKKIFKFQKNRCPITGFVSGRFCVDHCHRSGLVRGILSWKINKALAHFNDDPVLLRKAADYLETPPAVTALGEYVYGVIGSVSRMASRRKYGPNNTKTPQPR